MKRDTRHIIAEQAQRVILGGSPTPDTEVRTEELLIYVDQAFGKLIRNSYFENRADGLRQVNGSFIYSYEVDVDNSGSIPVARIPSTYINLPLGLGIYQVSFSGDPFNTIIPIDTSFMGLSNGLLVSRLEGRKCYYVENTKMYFLNLRPGECLDKVIIKLVGGIQPDDEVDPEVEMPLDMQNDLVQLAVQLYMTQQQMPKDKDNDNNKD